jgi:succinoglycan biosynthesis protein ExoO
MNKVSIIIPAYNTENFIKRCIDSVLNQSYQNFEIIIVDDCSTDNGMDIVRQFEDPRIRVYLNKKNCGPSFSRNRGIRLAKGSYIAILDSDDWWDKDRLKIMIDFVVRKNADMVFDNLLYIRENESAPWTNYFEFKKMTINFPVQITPQYFVDNDLGILKAVIRKELLMKNQIFYDESVKYGEDFLFYLDIITNTENVWLLPEAYYYYLSREGSLVKSIYQLAIQCIKSTDKIMENPSIANNPLLVQSLINRKRDLEVIKIYHETDQALKEKKLFKTFINLMKHPKIIPMITMVKLRQFKQNITSHK